MSFFTYSQDETYIKSGVNTIHLTSYGQGQPVLIINGGPDMNSEGLKNIKGPVLIIQGKQDIIDLETAEVAKSGLQNVALVILDACCH